MVAERIFNVMSAVFGIRRDELDATASPATIEQWDSMRHMNLILALEDEFGVRFPEEKMDRLVSFALIEQALGELSAH